MYVFFFETKKFEVKALVMHFFSEMEKFKVKALVMHFSSEKEKFEVKAFVMYFSLRQIFEVKALVPLCTHGSSHSGCHVERLHDDNISLSDSVMRAYVYSTHGSSHSGCHVERLHDNITLSDFVM